MPTYAGSCHCRAITFVVRSVDPIVSGKRCNCSMCSRRGSVMSATYIAPEDFELTGGRDALVLYQWGDRDMNHYFCRTCGIFPFSEIAQKPGTYRVNLGCLDGVDSLAVSVDVIDGKSF